MLPELLRSLTYALKNKSLEELKSGKHSFTCSPNVDSLG